MMEAADVNALLEVPLVNLELKLFERRNFDFITIDKGNKHYKQEQALVLLTDNVTKEIGYGGAAGGAKSWTGCAWLIFMCLLYPGSKWFIGREELKRLRDSTFVTFQKVTTAYAVTDWQYKAQDHYILFGNGSRIDLLDLKFLPTDALYERYGSTEYTGGWIEEGGEVHFGAFDTLKSRIGRHMNDKYGIIPKIYVTFNPKKNWVYTYFYQPFKSKLLKAGQAFIMALLYDNPHRESSYEAQLLGMSKVQKERLLHGNFEYDDDPSVLCDFDAIMDCFTNTHVLPTGKRKAISADLAMQGRDRFVAGSWNDLVVTIKLDKQKSTGKDIEEDLKGLMIKDGVGRSQTIADSDGLGAYLVSYLTGIQEFHGGAVAIDEVDFANLKSECGYKLAEKVNKRELLIICTSEQKERIKMELGVLRADDVNADEKRKKIIPKKKMKELLGFSPDYLDMLLMGMYFELKPPRKSTSSTWANAFG